MHEMIDELYELCETLEKDLKKTNEKLRKSGGELSGADLEYIDKLIHSLKSVKTAIAMAEGEGVGYSQNGDWEAMGRMTGTYGRGNSYANRGQHYVRGHYSRAGERRDGRGRYSRDGGYSNTGDFREMLEEAMESAPDEQSRAKLERMIRDM